jgi:hypothetical protein
VKTRSSANIGPTRSRTMLMNARLGVSWVVTGGRMRVSRSLVLLKSWQTVA